MNSLFEDIYAGKVAEQFKTNYKRVYGKLSLCTLSGLQRLWMTWPKI
jgi:hypothetical protein